MSIRTRIIIALLGTSLLAIALIGAQGFQMGFNTLERLSFDALTSIREAKRRQIEMMFHRARIEVRTLAASPGLSQILMQQNYEGYVLDFWQGIHKTLERENVYLFDRDGTLVLSASHRDIPSLDEASTSIYAEAFRRAMMSNKGDVSFVDFRHTHGEDEAPVAMMSSPIVFAGETLGAVVVQLSLQDINSVMTGDGQWERDGLGRTGETYIVGFDGLMRSDSRFMDELGADMKGHGTSILHQSVSSQAFEQALKGETGTAINLNYLGVSSNASFIPLNIEGVKWVLIAEISRDEALEPVFYFADFMALSAGIAMLVLAFIAFGISGTITKPLRILINGAREYRRGRFQSRIEGMRGKEMVELGDAFNSMADGLTSLLAEREKQLAIAKEASQMKSTFVANMSHELRTPLNAILGITEMVLEEARENGNEQFVEPLFRVSRAGEHLLGIINDILDISKIEAGKIELHPEEVAIARVVEDLEAQCLSLAEKNDNTFTSEVAEDVKFIRTDVMRLRQILLNIFANAFKFTKNGDVSLKVLLVDDGNGALMVRFDITDTGIGMTSEQMKRVFGEFSQADVTTTKEFGGTGLGMTISKKLAELMNGSIQVESNKDVGTCFSLLLPLDIMEGEQKKSAKPHDFTSHVELADVKGFVLVVDDEPTAREVIGNILLHSGYEVKLASNAAGAMELARDERCSAIVLDIGMPGVSGWDVLAALKSDPATEKKPVIMCSMYDEKNKGYALGAAEFISKPVRKDELLQAIHRHLGDRVRANVLVVDDNDDVRAMFHSALMKAGHRVREATNGIEALQQMETNLPDLVILDLMMPVMDGFEFLDRIDKTKAFQSVPIIVATSIDLTTEQIERIRRSAFNIIERGGKELSSYAGQIVHAVAKATQKTE